MDVPDKSSVCWRAGDHLFTCIDNIMYVLLLLLNLSPNDEIQLAALVGIFYYFHCSVR